MDKKRAAGHRIQQTHHEWEIRGNEQQRMRNFKKEWGGWIRQKGIEKRYNKLKNQKNHN